MKTASSLSLRAKRDSVSNKYVLGVLALQIINKKKIFFTIVISIINVFALINFQHDQQVKASVINDYIKQEGFSNPTIEYQIKSQFPKFGYYDANGNEMPGPNGIVIHETSNPGSTIQNEIDYQAWNYNEAFVHAFVDWNQAIIIHPTEYGAWGAGPIANKRFIHIELLHLKNYSKYYFAKSVNNDAFLAASLLIKHNLKPDLADYDGQGTIWSHNAVSNWLGGTDHEDPVSYFNSYGYSMSEFFNLVNQKYEELGGYDKPKEPVKHPLNEGMVVDTKNQSIWKDLDFSKENSSTNSQYGNLLTAKNVYDHPNGSKYYDLYSNNSFLGYINTSFASQMTCKSYDYASMAFDSIKTYSNFSTDYQYGTLKYGQKFKIKLIYNSSAFGRVASIYDASGKTWLGYVPLKTIQTNQWQNANGTWYYFGSDGQILTGWQYIQGAWYYFDGNGKMLTGWAQINGGWYYLNSWGGMQKGWLNIKNAWYYLGDEGKMRTGIVQVGSSKFYFDAWGRMLTGWQYVGNKWYYFNENGYMLTKWQYINSRWYYLNENGQMLTMWQYINNHWCYLNENGQMLTGWQYIYNHWYFLDTNGYMKTGWQFMSKWYFMNQDGILQRGWYQDNNVWYYSDSNDNLYTGLKRFGNEWFYFYNWGGMAKDWQLVNNKWNFFDYRGARAQGRWILYKDNWYYLNVNGDMLTGLQKINNNWYYLNNTLGTMVTGWLKDNNNWYYFNLSGARQVGWIKLGATWYYLDQSAKMVTGNQWINGVNYKFNNSGALID